MKIKLYTPIMIVIVLSFALSGCSSVVSSSQGQVGRVLLNALDNSVTGAATETPDSAPTLSAIQLALGTIKLDGSTNAVSASQAATLLPLWQALKTAQAAAQPATPAAAGTSVTGATPEAMPTRDNAAEQAVTAEVKLIYADMTAAQLQAIVDMKLNRETISTTLTGLGITIQNGFGPMDGSGTNAAGTPWPTLAPGVTVTPRPTPAGGQKPGGSGNGPAGQGQPPAGGKPGAGQSGNGMPGANGTQTAAGGNLMENQGNGMDGHDNYLPSEVIDAVITYLQKLTA